MEAAAKHPGKNLNHNGNENENGSGNKESCEFQ
jgi:hypothetical protein